MRNGIVLFEHWRLRHLSILNADETFKGLCKGRPPVDGALEANNFENKRLRRTNSVLLNIESISTSKRRELD